MATPIVADHYTAAGNYQNLFVAKLPLSVSNAELMQVFAPFSPSSATVMLDPVTGRSKGYAFVLFAKEEDGRTAAATLDKKTASVTRTGEDGATTTFVLDLTIFASKHSGKDVAVENECLYIRNIPNSWPMATVESFIAQHGKPVYSAVRSDHLGSPVWVVFVEYDSVESARNTLKALHGMVIAPRSPPILAKYAETEDVKKSRRERKMSGKHAKNAKKEATQDAPVTTAAEADESTTGAAVVEQQDADHGANSAASRRIDVALQMHHPCHATRYDASGARVTFPTPIAAELLSPHPHNNGKMRNRFGKSASLQNGAGVIEDAAKTDNHPTAVRPINCEDDEAGNSDEEDAESMDEEARAALAGRNTRPFHSVTTSPTYPVRVPLPFALPLPRSKQQRQQRPHREAERENKDAAATAAASQSVSSSADLLTPDGSAPNSPNDRHQDLRSFGPYRPNNGHHNTHHYGNNQHRHSYGQQNGSYAHHARYGNAAGRAGGGYCSSYGYGNSHFRHQQHQHAYYQQMEMWNSYYGNYYGNAMMGADSDQPSHAYECAEEGANNKDCAAVHDDHAKTETTTATGGASSSSSASHSGKGSSTLSSSSKDEEPVVRTTCLLGLGKIIMSSSSPNHVRSASSMASATMPSQPELSDSTDMAPSSGNVNSSSRFRYDPYHALKQRQQRPAEKA